MKKVNLEFELYSFDELDEETQEQVVHWYVNNYLSHENTKEFIDCVHNFLDRLGFKDVKLDYNLTYDDDSGLAFDFM